MLNFLKKKKIVSVVHLSGIIGNIGGLRSGLTISNVQPLLEKAFKLKKQSAVALIINSPGGSVTAGLAIYDTIQYIKPDISTVCVGQAASMGSLLLAAGTIGKRYALPNARIMMHQPSGGIQGQATDIQIHANEILALRSNINQIYVKHTGQELKKIEENLDRDNFLGPEEAKEFGLIDKIVVKRVDIEKKID